MLPEPSCSGCAPSTALTSATGDGRGGTLRGAAPPAKASPPWFLHALMPGATEQHEHGIRVYSLARRGTWLCDSARSLERESAASSDTARTLGQRRSSLGSTSRGSALAQASSRATGLSRLPRDARQGMPIEGRSLLPHPPRHALRTRDAPCRLSCRLPWLSAQFRFTVRLPRRAGRTAEDDMDGWWCVRYGDALARMAAG